MKRSNIILNDAKFDEISKIYETQKEGLKACVENYLMIRKSVLLRLKGKFTREELIAIVEMHNSSMYDPTFSSPSLLVAHLEDAEKFENVCSKNNVDIADLSDKISGLTHPESLVLIEWAYLFWYGPGYGKLQLEEYLKQLV